MSFHQRFQSNLKGQSCEVIFVVVVLLCYLSLTTAFSLGGSTAPQSTVSQQVLKQGDSVGPKISGGDRQVFNIQLTAGEIVEISVAQRSAMLMATLFDEQNNEVIAMDYPGGAYGPIYFSATAATSGPYRLEIHSINKWALPSNYELTLKSIRIGNNDDKPVADAYLSFYQGRKNSAAGKSQEAIAAFEKSLSFWQSSGNTRWQAVTQYAMSEVYRNRVIDKWEASLNETLRLLEPNMDPADWRLKASALNDLGARFISNEPDKARDLLNKALDLYRDHGDRRGQASALNQLAQVDVLTGEYLKALSLVQDALDLRKLENDKPGASNLIGALASISDLLGESEKAREYAVEALKNWEELTELDRTYLARFANAINSVAVTNDKLGRWTEALELYDKSLATYEKDHPGSAGPLDNKGELYAALGDSDKARECYMEALRLLDAASGRPNPNIKASVLVHLGQLSLADNDAITAIKYFEDARSLKPPDRRLADVLINLGNGLAQREPDKAIEAYQTALAIQEKLKDLRGQALAVQKRGEVRARSGKQSEALEDFNRALNLWKTVKDSRGEATTLNNIAQLERDRGNLTTALARSNEAIQKVESLRTNISSRQLRASYFAGQTNYYALNVDLKMQLYKKENRSEYLSEAFESAEKSRARVLLDALNEAGLDRGEFNQNSDPNFGRLLEQRSDLLNKLSAKIQARTNSLSGAYSRDQIAKFDREINKLNDNYDSLEARIRSKNPRFATLTKSQPATVEEIQAQLDEQTILIEYLLGDTRSYVWIVTRNSIDGFELPPRAQIEALATRVYEALSAYGRNEKNESRTQRIERVTKAENDFAPASSLLSEMILSKIAHLLGEKRLLIVADGTLQTLPFGVLPPPKPATVQTSHTTSPSAIIDPLLDQHEIINFPSASILVLQRRELARRRSAPHTVAVIADPVFDKKDERVASLTSLKAKPASKSSATKSGRYAAQTRFLSDMAWSDSGAIRRLDFSFYEASAIFKLVPSNQTFKALDFKASRATLLSPELSRYRIIHLATHGIMNLSQPELSGVILSLIDENGRPTDGYVGLNDIYNLNLPADLVVLSACETGIGKQIKGEGTIALTRGFMHAGAQRVVASLWKVDDKVTADLMIEFYKEMLENKRTPAAALRAAELALYRRNLKPHFWAGFVLQGEWR